MVSGPSRVATITCWMSTLLQLIPCLFTFFDVHKKLMKKQVIMTDVSRILLIMNTEQTGMAQKDFKPLFYRIAKYTE